MARSIANHDVLNAQYETAKEAATAAVSKYGEGKEVRKAFKVLSVAIKNLSKYLAENGAY